VPELLAPAVDCLAARLHVACLPASLYAGVEGAFRLGCERTLGALRSAAAPLCALLGAALADPGVDWDAETAAKAASKARSSLLGHLSQLVLSLVE
jgi:hypothetical protein